MSGHRITAALPQWTLGRAVRDRAVSAYLGSRTLASDREHDDLRELGELDERALVDACLAGRREAFDIIVERHRRTVYQVCYRFVHSHEDASDLAQDVFLRAYRGLRRFKRQASLATWLYRIAVNVGLSHVASRRAAADPIDVEQHVDDRAGDPLEATLHSERAAAIRSAITRLPRKQRATVILRVYQELSHEQIAGILGSSVGAVKANFCHAIGNLRRILQATGARLDEEP
jgi:RNA polymerase sigma-70 factor (ECF subfamily)